MRHLLITGLIALIFFGCKNELPIIENGKVEIIRDFNSKLISSRTIEVYTPPGYSVGESYPVLYLHDGQNVFSPTGAYTGIEWGVDEALDSLIRDGFIEPAIGVAIHNSKYRWNEYLPEACLLEPLDSSKLMPYARQSIWDTTVFSKKYIKFIVEEVKPFIDKMYATDPSQNYIMGSSMGGLISLYIINSYPKVFQGAACLSTHWPALDGKCVEELVRNMAFDGVHEFYFDYGNKGLDSLYQPYQHRVDSLSASRQGYIATAYESRFFYGADHNEASWNERIAIPLVFLLGKGNELE